MGANVLMAALHRIAGINFRTESNSPLPGFQEGLFEKYFRVSAGVPDVYHRIRKVPAESLVMPAPVGDERSSLSTCATYLSDGLESNLLRSPEVRGRLRACLNQRETVHIWLDKEIVIIRDFATRELDLFYSDKFGKLVQRYKAHMPDHYVTSNFRIVFSSFLPCFSAVLVHSSGVIRNGVAAIFLAPDGGGKTTLLRHSMGVPILDDDQVIFRKNGHTVMAHGTPLGCLTSGPYQAKIGGLFLLEKASHFELVPLNPADVMQILWTEHRGVTCFLPKSLKVAAFDVFNDACHQAPLYRLRFPQDYVDWNAIDAAMVR
jgi:hypothetical protein